MSEPKLPENFKEAWSEFKREAAASPAGKAYKFNRDMQNAQWEQIKSTWRNSYVGQMQQADAQMRAKAWADLKKSWHQSLFGQMQDAQQKYAKDAFNTITSPAKTTFQGIVKVFKPISDNIKETNDMNSRLIQKLIFLGPHLMNKMFEQPKGRLNNEATQPVIKPTLSPQTTMLKPLTFNK